MQVEEREDKKIFLIQKKEKDECEFTRICIVFKLNFVLSFYLEIEWMSG
jgi:hypothetical protein